MSTHNYLNSQSANLDIEPSLTGNSVSHAVLNGDVEDGNSPSTAGAVIESLSLIWAQSRAGVIGAGGDIPWHLPGEQRHFRELTQGGTVIMGRATWDSLPERVRPLPGRKNIVLSRNPEFVAPGAVVVTSVDAALAASAASDSGKAVWCMGGAQLYAEMIDRAVRLEVTEIAVEVNGDAFAPTIGPQWVLDGDGPWQLADNGIRFRFLSYRRHSGRSTDTTTDAIVGNTEI